MKFMLTWTIHTNQRENAMKAFSQMTEEHDAADMGSEITLIGRWHNLAEFTGVAVFETNDPTALANWALNWNSILDARIAPVYDDEETRAIGRSRLSE